jgi:hypothetical protein
MPVTTLDPKTALCDLDFNVTLPLAAVTDIDAASHVHATTRVFPRIAATGLTADVLALLTARRFGRFNGGNAPQ